MAEGAGRLVVEWGVPGAVAASLERELHATLYGFDPPDARTVRVRRERQLQAIARHRSQNPDNPVLRRRLQLLGDTERIRVRSAPFSARPPRGGAHTS